MKEYKVILPGTGMGRCQKEIVIYDKIIVLEKEFPIEILLDPKKSFSISKEVAVGADYSGKDSDSTKGDEVIKPPEVPGEAEKNNSEVDEVPAEEVTPEVVHSGESEENSTEAESDEKLPAPDDWKVLLDKAICLHKLGVEGDKEAVREAYDILGKVHELAPDNNYAEAYYGSATCLLGRDVADPMEKFNKAIRGLKILDRCVAREPGNVEIRTLRAKVCYRLPERYFHRTETAIEDFTYMADICEKEAGVFPQEFYCQVLYDLGASYKRLGRNSEAESTWQKLLKSTSDPKYLKLIEKEGISAPGPTTATVAPAVNSGIEKPVSNIKKLALEEGIEWHRKALQGDKNSLGNAISFFEAAAQEYPDDHLVKAYYGDCLSLAGREGKEIKDMFTGAHKAMEAMDDAINLSPDDIEIRFLRAYHSFRLPEALFHRSATAVVDFEYLIRRYEEDSTIFPIEKYRQILFDLGEAYSRLGLKEASKSARYKLLSLNPGAEYEAMIEKKHSLDSAVTTLENLSPDSRKELYDEGFRLHDLAVAGSKAAAEAALELWQKALEKDPLDALTQAYYGSSLALVGRDSNQPQTLFGHTIKGLKMVSRAVEQDGSDLRIRILRAYLTNSLPKPLLMQADGPITDFRFLKMCYEENNSVFSEDFYHKVLYDLGVAYQREGEIEKAKGIWEQLLQVSKDPKYKKLLIKE
ncbi:MAG: tetratricopeptide repeat protein [Bacillota bacterium]